MKRLAFALGLVAATALAAPLSAQSRSDGPWWDPANNDGRTGSTTRADSRNGTIYNDGRIDSRRADGQWRLESRDRNGNRIYVRTRYDSNGNLIQERARRDSLGRYRVIDRRVLSSANRRQNGDYNRDRNDRWDQNNGHDNGKHNGWYKNGKNGQYDGRYDNDRRSNKSNKSSKSSKGRNR
jgi:hypothetical protein